METYNQLLRAEYIKYWETKKRKRLNDGKFFKNGNHHAPTDCTH